MESVGSQRAILYIKSVKHPERHGKVHEKDRNRRGHPLYGDINVSGMKNAALPIIFASILTKDKCVIENLPEVSDVSLSLRILRAMGASVRMINRTTVEIDTTHFVGGSSPYQLVSKLRGSTYLLGAELGRFGEAPRRLFRRL